MTQVDANAFEKLKFLFWKYLDWRQRLKVLIKAEVLPSTADKPISQTMEQLALENAREQNKLDSVWNAMIEYLPENKRQSNPFIKE